MTITQWNRVPSNVQADVLEFIHDNNLADTIESLTPDEVFDYYLQWHGIVGWTYRLTDLLQSLGWRKP